MAARRVNEHALPAIRVLDPAARHGIEVVARPATAMVIKPQHADRRQRSRHRPARRRRRALKATRRRGPVSRPFLPGRFDGRGRRGCFDWWDGLKGRGGVGDHDPGRLSDPDESVVRRVPGNPGRPRDPADRNQPVAAQAADRLPARHRHPARARRDRPGLGETRPPAAVVLTVEPALVPGHRHRCNHQMRQTLPTELLDPSRGHPAVRAARDRPRDCHDMHRPRTIRLTLERDDLDAVKPEPARHHSTVNLEHTHPSAWRSLSFDKT